MIMLAVDIFRGLNMKIKYLTSEGVEVEGLVDLLPDEVVAALLEHVDEALHAGSGFSELLELAEIFLCVLSALDTLLDLLVLGHLLQNLPHTLLHVFLGHSSAHVAGEGHQVGLGGDVVVVPGLVQPAELGEDTKFTLKEF